MLYLFKKNAKTRLRYWGGFAKNLSRREDLSLEPIKEPWLGQWENSRYLFRYDLLSQMFCAS